MTLQRTYSAGYRCKFINLDQTDLMDYFDIYPTFIKKQASRNSFDISYELNNFETHFSYTQYFNYLNIESTSNQDLDILTKIQDYADKTYLVTINHINSVKQLTTKEAVESYDYTKNYPEILKFN